MNFVPDPAIKALIFDVDGTLLDSMPVHHQAWREALTSYDIDVDATLFREFAGRTTEHIVEFLVERFGVELPADELGIAKDQAFVRHAPLIQPIAPVLDIAHHYSSKLSLGAATNEHFGVANIVLRATGLSPLFQVLVTADEVERPKPAPDLFLACAERLGVAPTACHVFEDTRWGIDAAQAAGMSVTDVATLR